MACHDMKNTKRETGQTKMLEGLGITHSSYLGFFFFLVFKSWFFKFYFKLFKWAEIVMKFKLNIG